MQIREQGFRVQCIRAVYDHELKRCPQKLVFSFPKGTTPLPADLALLTDAERQQLDEWMQARKDTEDRARLNSGLALITHSIDTAAQALDAGSVPPAPDAIWAAMAKLAKALRKAGYQKPQPKRTKHVPGCAGDGGAGELFGFDPF